MSETAQAQKISIEEQIAGAIEAAAHQVRAAIELLDGGATVPFISRYRKEATGGLSDAQLRLLDERLGYLRDLEDRRQTIRAAIEEQGKLDDGLRARIQAVQTKAELEDLYLPFRKKRRTKGQMAIEAGLEPLADLLWSEPDTDPNAEAEKYISKANTQNDPDSKAGAVGDVKAALDGARFILMERFAEDAGLIARLRDLMVNQSYLCATVAKGKESEGVKFSDYFDHQESFAKVPGHRALAMFRGRSEGVLSLNLKLPQADEYGDDACIAAIARHLGFSHAGKAADDWRAQVVAWTWKIKLSLHLETELFGDLRTRADAQAISVFAANLQDLLLAAPAGPRATLALDPGYRSGVKITVIDGTGKVVAHTAVFPHKPQQQWQATLATLEQLCVKHSVELIAIGNGTASRETEKLAQELIKIVAALPEGRRRHMTPVVVSEAGASVYSASKTAEDEFPDLDVTIRGAISIGRRLQDPLAELVKIDPKAIGVGQYQHDVSQSALARSLEATVEDCVNAVGVDLGTASAALLSRVAGLTPTLASNIVGYRDEHGVFKSRSELKKVPRLGPKAFEQAAGFLRIANGKNPLDSSGVHPEAYPVVKRIIEKLNKPIESVIGDTTALRALNPSEFTDEQFGLPTVQDIFKELEKPGRDPRPEFKTVQFADGIEKISDLLPNQVLEGKVTNVTAFGAFVDVGVHQDGLVHISALSDTYVKDPRDVVKAGDVVKVKVMSVDVQRQRIALTMRLSDDARDESQTSSRNAPARSRPGNTGRRQVSSGQGKPGSEKSGHSRNAGRRNQQPSGSDQPSALALSLKAALESNR